MPRSYTKSRESAFAIRLVMYVALLAIGFLILRNAVVDGLPVLDASGGMRKEGGINMVALLAGGAIAMIGTIGTGAVIAERVRERRR